MGHHEKTLVSLAVWLGASASNSKILPTVTTPTVLPNDNFYLVAILLRRSDLVGFPIGSEWAKIAFTGGGLSERTAISSSTSISSASSRQRQLKAFAFQDVIVAAGYPSRPAAIRDHLAGSEVSNLTIPLQTMNFSTGWE